MENLLTDIPTTLTGWITIGAVILAGYFFVRRADIASINQANENLHQLVESQEKTIVELRRELEVMKKDFYNMQGIVKEKDQRISALEQVQVTQTLSPEMISYMKDMTALKDEVKLYMKDTRYQLTEINAKMK